MKLKTVKRLMTGLGIAAVAVVLLGVHLVRGKRKPKEEEYVEYRGERHD